MRLIRLSPVAEEAVHCVQVGLGGGVSYVCVRRFPDVLPLRKFVLDADRNLAQGIDSGCYAAEYNNITYVRAVCESGFQANSLAKLDLTLVYFQVP